MSRTLIHVLLLVAFLLVPLRAQAMPSLFWLDRLSGPGPWVMLDFEIRMKCFGGQKVPEAKPTRAITKCLDKVKKHKRSLNLVAGIAWAPYRGGTSFPRTTFTRLGISHSWTFNERVSALTVGVEWDQFFGRFDGGRYSSFPRLALPVSFSVKPFARADGTDPVPTWRDKLTLRVGALIYPRKFTAEDFGGRAGSYESQAVDVVPMIGVDWDFGARE